MLSIHPPKPSGNIIRSPHFWVILVISLALVFIYQSWPWRALSIGSGFPLLTSLDSLAFWEVRNRIIGVLFLIPIIYATVAFSWRGALVSFLVALAGILPILTRFRSTNNIITNIGFLILPFLIVSVVAFELAWRRKEKKNSAEREAQRELYMSKILESQEHERRRVAQELHDGIIQTLLVIANRAQKLISSGHEDTVEMKGDAQWIRDSTLKAVEDIRRISLDLRPSILDDLGLVPALRWLVDERGKESGINTKILINREARKLSPQTEVGIFRIVQEALNNIQRHSKATEAVVNLEFAEQCLKITIEDNGRGFAYPKHFDGLATRGKLGLIGIKQRIDFLGGTFEIQSRSREGTKLLIEAKY
jgi:two-component system sensor histidine kinase DegS